MESNKILLITNALSPPYDEGFKKTALHLVEALREQKSSALEVLRLAGTPGKFLVPALWYRVSHRSPAYILYLPSSSLTDFSLLRAALLKILFPKSCIGFIALQPRYPERTLRMLPKRYFPDLVFVQNPEMLERLQDYGLRPRLIPSGVDLKRFRPVPPSVKDQLRRKYGLPEREVLALHVGHLSPHRNLEWLIPLKNSHITPVAVLSTSTSEIGNPRDLQNVDDLYRKLQAAGVILLHRYIPHIWEIYQAVDLYVFPVRNTRGSIGVPLSILEAMACNLPVVTTPFGSLPQWIPEGEGIYYVRTVDEFLQAATSAVQR